MKYTIEDITLNDIVCTIELELEIACFCEDIEVEDFTVLNVECEDLETGICKTLSSAKDTNQLTLSYTYEIQKELDNDETLINQITDYFQDGQTERDIDNYEYNRDYGTSCAAENIMFGGVDY